MFSIKVLQVLFTLLLTINLCGAVSPSPEGSSDGLPGRRVGGGTRLLDMTPPQTTYLVVVVAGLVAVRTLLKKKN